MSELHSLDTEVGIKFYIVIYYLICTGFNWPSSLDYLYRSLWITLLKHIKEIPPHQFYISQQKLRSPVCKTLSHFEALFSQSLHQIFLFIDATLRWRNCLKWQTTDRTIPLCEMQVNTSHKQCGEIWEIIMCAYSNMIIIIFWRFANIPFSFHFFSSVMKASMELFLGKSQVSFTDWKKKISALC